MPDYTIEANGKTFKIESDRPLSDAALATYAGSGAPAEPSAPEKPPTWTSMTGDLLSGVGDRVGPYVPEGVKQFGAEMNKPLVGGFSGTDLALGGPLGGLAVAGAVKGVRALRGGQKALGVADAMIPTPHAMPPKPRSMSQGMPSSPPSPGAVRMSPSLGAEPPVVQPPAGSALRPAAPGPVQFRPTNSHSNPEAGIAGAQGLTYNDIRTLESSMPVRGRITKIKQPTQGMSDIVEQGRATRTRDYREGADLDIGAKRLIDTPETSHGGSDQWNRITQDMRGAGGDAQFAAKRARGRAMKGWAKKNAGDESGVVNPALLRGVGGAVGGGVIGGAVDKDDPLRGAVLGAAGGAAAANPKAALNAAMQLRSASFLSGLAPIKSVLGNAGSIPQAAVSLKSMKPFKEALRLPTNLRNVKDGWQASANPSQTFGVGKLNPIGRGMGAVDNATQQVLERSGLAPEDAQKLLLTNPNGMANELSKLGPLGRVAVPFQLTPTNYFLTGAKHIGEAGSRPLRENAMTAAAVGSGAVTGNETDDIRKLGLGGAAWGGRGLPFMLGAALTAGPRALSGTAPVSEWGIQQMYSDFPRFAGLDPAFNRAYGQGQTGRPPRQDANSRPPRPKRER